MNDFDHEAALFQTSLNKACYFLFILDNQDSHSATSRYDEIFNSPMHFSFSKQFLRSRSPGDAVSATKEPKVLQHRQIGIGAKSLGHISELRAPAIALASLDQR